MMHAKLQCYPPGGFYRSAIVYHVLQGVCHCLYYIAGTSIYCKELVPIAQHSLRHLDTILEDSANHLLSVYIAQETFGPLQFAE